MRVLEEGCRQGYSDLREIILGVLSASFHSDLLYCIIFHFLDYFASVDLFVRSVSPGDCSRTALSVVQFLFVLGQI